MPRILRAAFAVVALLLSLLVMPALAGAAPGDGATVTNQDINNLNCDSSFGYTYCFSQVGTIHTTMTPSGNQSFAFDVIECNSFTEDATGTVVDHGCTTVKGHGLTQDGMLQALGQHTSGTETAGGQTCTYTEAVHLANGQVQFDRVTNSCQ